MKHVLETEKTSSVVKVDDVETSLKDIKMEEVTTVKTDLDNVVGNSEDGNTENKKETKNDGENRKINLKTEIEDREVNLEKNRKQIMSVENNEERSESKKVKTSREETNHKIEETNEESVQENELNEIKIEDTIQNGQFPENINERNDNDTNKNGSQYENSQYEKRTEMNNIEDLNGLKDRNRKVQETLRETLPDELSNSDLDVLQDNSTKFICLTDSSKCLSKSTSILLTTGILIGIIVGLVTIVGITTGLSVYIFHRWKLRKKPRDRSRTSKMDRVVSSTTRRPVKNRSTKRKLNLREVMEENDSPVNTLEAITVHNYREVGRYSYNL
ncbi:TNF receptor-associated factor family protein DDB_G0272098-like [Centruroides sculpturatus]|uniref:TNF receptor-associated factor family protein DDB_G0272098-like n=1 Tax=Centruroides sculpturatus TaxID=218467 RepID=UPI000C6D5CC0|nr:TNF receptor-associated factor family protein DDB_G0272098-like [Centruroides sculpturatus]